MTRREYLIAMGEPPGSVAYLMRCERERIDALVAQDEDPAGVECGAVSQLGDGS